MTEKEAKVAKIVGDTVNPSEYARDPKKQKGTGFLYNVAYWKGYNEAKEEIKVRLYKAMGIELPVAPKTNPSEVHEVFDGALFTKPPMV